MKEQRREKNKYIGLNRFEMNKEQLKVARIVVRIDDDEDDGDYNDLVVPWLMARSTQ